MAVGGGSVVKGNVGGISALHSSPNDDKKRTF